MVRAMNGRHAWLFVFVVFASLAITQPVFAQAGVIQGFVRDAQGKPIDGAKITIVSPTSGRKYETKSNAKGEFGQVGLFSGAYSVTAEYDNLGSNMTVGVRQGQPARVAMVLAPGAGLSREATAKNAELQKLFGEGIAADQAGNFDEAIAKFTQATQLNAACADCYFNLALSEANKKEYDKAEAAFKKAIEVKPDHADAYAGLASVYNAQRKFDEAAAASAKSSEFLGGAGGGNADALFNQGVILWNGGKVAEAKKQFEAAIQANPNHAEAHYQLAMALVNEGNLAGATTEFDTYLKLAPSGPNAAQAKALLSQLPK